MLAYSTPTLVTKCISLARPWCRAGTGPVRQRGLKVFDDLLARHARPTEKPSLANSADACQTHARPRQHPSTTWRITVTWERRNAPHHLPLVIIATPKRPPERGFVCVFEISATWPAACKARDGEALVDK
jgi:hypothetical protein